MQRRREETTSVSNGAGSGAAAGEEAGQSSARKGSEEKNPARGEPSQALLPE